MSGHDDGVYQHVEPLLGTSFSCKMTEVNPIFVVTHCVVSCACTSMKLDKLIYFLVLAFTVFCTYVFSHTVLFVMACEMSLESLGGCDIYLLFIVRYVKILFCVLSDRAMLKMA